MTYLIRIGYLVIGLFAGGMLWQKYHPKQYATESVLFMTNGQTHYITFTDVDEHFITVVYWVSPKK